MKEDTEEARDMTLLDYFASKIVSGCYNSKTIWESPKSAVKHIYNLAEAMVEESKRRRGL